MKNNNSYEDKLNAIVKLESYIFEYIDFFASVLLNEASKEKKWSYDQKQIQKLLNARVNITSISNDLIILEKSKCSIITNIRTLVNYLYDVYELVYFSFEILNIYKSKNLTKKNKSKINKIKNNFEKLNIIFWLKFMRNLLTHSIFMQGYNSEKKQVSYENLKIKLNFTVKNNLIMLSEKQIFNKNKIINQQLKKMDYDNLIINSFIHYFKIVNDNERSTWILNLIKEEKMEKYISINQINSNPNYLWIWVDTNYNYYEFIDNRKNYIFIFGFNVIKTLKLFVEEICKILNQILTELKASRLVISTENFQIKSFFESMRKVK
ncbi:hypothetical protein [Spiroplasma endosymbiont of Tricholauxania praeusta]|uniref:hypothetical protein n=1 Tax=Spiroplasma endosymbiont of Tricholauxania praeusta TaxID=3066296 RepID=UPI0030D02F7B